MSNLKHYIWSALNKFGVEVLAFVGNVLLARVLSPGDFGLIAMLAIFSAISMTFSDAGFNDCLIRKQDSDKQDFGTVATYNMVVSTILYLTIFALAPKIAMFFNREELTLLARVMCISIIFRSFTLSGFVQLSKGLQFKKIALINTLATFFSITIAYIGARHGLGYWALGIQPILLSFFNVIFLLIIAKWRPYFCFSISRFKDMFSYSSNLLLSYLINTIGSNLYSFFIGRNYTSTNLGLYNQAYKMQSLPTQGINGVILTTSYPLIANENDESKRYKYYVNLFNQYVFIIGYVVFALISLSYVIFGIILGEQWLPCIQLFNVLILASLFYPIVTINANIIKIEGRASLYRNLTFLRNALQIVAIIITSLISMKAIVLGYLVATAISALCDMFFCGKTIGFTFERQIKMFGKQLFKPIISYIISYVIVLGITNPLYRDCIGFILYSACFLVLCISLNDTVFFTFLKKVNIHSLKK